MKNIFKQKPQDNTAEIQRQLSQAARSTGPFKRQYGLIFDLISEGEIEGLVNGLSSIYFDDTPIVSSIDSPNGPRRGRVSVAGDQATFSTPILAGMSAPRSIQIMGAHGAGTCSADRGSFSVSVTDSSVLSGLQPSGNIQASNARIHISGAGQGGSDYEGTITGIDGSTVTVWPQIATSVSDVDYVVDFVGTITSINSDTTATLSSSVNRNVTNAPAQILAAPGGYQSDRYNFENAMGDLVTGTREQAPFARAVGAPSASFVHAQNSELLWHTDFGGEAGSLIINPTATAGLNLSSAQAQEIDKVKLTVEFPGGLLLQREGGGRRIAVAEFQVFLRFRKAAGAPEQTVMVLGRPSNQIPAWTESDRGVTDRHPPTLPSIIANETESAFLEEIIIDLDQFKPLHEWTLEIKRCTPHDGAEYEPRTQHTAIVTASLKNVEAQVLDKLSYPNSAIGLASFNAEDFPTPPVRGYHIRGKKVMVPSNYITREEAGSNQAKYTRNVETGVDENEYQPWDGSFRGDKKTFSDPQHPNYTLTYTNNPAWIFLDVLVNKDYGLGNYIRFEDINVFALYEIARYCDELVPDGRGGQEPRFTCNVYFQNKEEAFKVLKDLASTFRGMLYWLNGQVTPVQDRPKEPIYNFTAANVIDGIFNYEGVGEKARPNQINVTWNDPEQLYRQDVVVVDDVESIVNTGKVITKDVVAFGCTSLGQATRVGNWNLATSQLEDELVSFQTSINASFIEPGSVVNISDPYRDNIQLSGRLPAFKSSVNKLVLDREVELQSGQDYKVYLVFAKPGTYVQQTQATIDSITYNRGDLIPGVETKEAARNLVDDNGDPVSTTFSENTITEVRNITTGAGHHTEIEVDQPFSQVPGDEAIWAISNVTYGRVDAPQRYRILSITEDEEEKYSIVAARYAIEKYTEIEKSFLQPFEQYRPTSGRDEVVPAPRGVSIQLSSTSGVDYEIDGNALQALISWEEPEETFTDSNGNTIQTTYRFIDSYEVEHNLKNPDRGSKFDREIIASGKNSLLVENVGQGNYMVRVRTRNTDGRYSHWVTYDQDTFSRQIPDPYLDRLTRIVLGGSLTSPVQLDTDTLKIGNASYTFVSSLGRAMNIVAATSAQSEQSFSGLPSGEEAYWYFDFSESPDNPWKAVQIHVDEAVQNASGSALNFSYWKELGASNNGLVLKSGTASIQVGSKTVIGSGTSFTSDFEPGDLIKLSTEDDYSETASSSYFEVAKVVSDTELKVTITNNRGDGTQFVYAQQLKPDFVNDNILAKVINDGGVFEAELYVLTSGRQGVDGVPGDYVQLTNEAHVFPADNDGVVASYTGFASQAIVRRGTVQYTYDDSVTPDPETFSLDITATDIDFSVASNGFITVSNMTEDEADLVVDVIDNETSEVLGTRIIVFAKARAGAEGVDGVRGSGVFTFEQNTTPEISSSDVDDFAGTLTTTAAQNVAEAVINASDDGFIRPNDRVTVADAMNQIAASRIYTGGATPSPASVGTGDWSTVVTQIIDGSLIVEGTVSANQLAAEITYTGELRVTNEIVIGAPGDQIGAFRSINKSSFTDTSPGWWAGFVNGDPVFNWGNSTNYLEFDANGELNYSGTINITSGNIAGNMTMLSGGRIQVGNIDIDGQNQRILVSD